MSSKYSITVICDTREEALALIQGAESLGIGVEVEKPKRARKATAETAAPTPAPTDLSAVLGLPTAQAQPQSLDSLLGLGTSAGTLPPAASAAPAAIQPTVVAAPALTQQDVIKAFVTLAQKPGKGNDAVREVITALKVATVTAIQPAQYADAIALVQQKLA